MTKYSKYISKKEIAQTDKAKENQVKNNAGGYVFKLDDFKRLERFLILGADSGTYYVSEKELTLENAKCIEDCLKKDFYKTIKTIVEISESGRAPKNDPAIFALAIAASCDNKDARKEALYVMPRVCRTGTHLFQFVESVNNLRGWGRALRRGVSKWYTDKKYDQLAYQLVKYQSRNGWTHKDVLRLAGGEISPTSPHHMAALRWAVAGPDYGKRTVTRKVNGKDVTKIYDAIKEKDVPKILQGYEILKKEKDPNKVAELIHEYGFTHEMIPTDVKDNKIVWDALLENMPITAMIRNLGKMTQIGLLNPLSEGQKKVVSKLTDEHLLRKGRVHPMTILMAQKVYSAGRGIKGSLTWQPNRAITDALDDAFYKSFEFVEPTGKNTLLALDVSGSMGATIAGTFLTAREASAAMAMVTAKTESNWHCMGFTAGDVWAVKSGITHLNISPKMRLDDIVTYISRLSFGATDCAQPMLYALKNKVDVDTFVVYTDNETYYGNIHPFQALKDYRNKMNKPNAKLIVVGMTSSGFSIADPDDPGMLDVVGFDTAAPALISDFARQ